MLLRKGKSRSSCEALIDHFLCCSIWHHANLVASKATAVAAEIVAVGGKYVRASGSASRAGRAPSGIRCELAPGARRFGGEHLAQSVVAHGRGIPAGHML